MGFFVGLKLFLGGISFLRGGGGRGEGGGLITGGSFILKKLFGLYLEGISHLKVRDSAPENE